MKKQSAFSEKYITDSIKRYSLMWLSKFADLQFRRVPKIL